MLDFLKSMVNEKIQLVESDNNLCRCGNSFDSFFNSKRHAKDLTISAVEKDNAKEKYKVRLKEDKKTFIAELTKMPANLIYQFFYTSPVDYLASYRNEFGELNIQKSIYCKSNSRLKRIGKLLQYKAHDLSIDFHLQCFGNTLAASFTEKRDDMVTINLKLKLENNRVKDIHQINISLPNGKKYVVQFIIDTLATPEVILYGYIRKENGKDVEVTDINEKDSLDKFLLEYSDYILEIFFNYNEIFNKFEDIYANIDDFPFTITAE